MQNSEDIGRSHTLVEVAAAIVETISGLRLNRNDAASANKSVRFMSGLQKVRQRTILKNSTELPWRDAVCEILGNILNSKTVNKQLLATEKSIRQSCEKKKVAGSVGFQIVEKRKAQKVAFENWHFSLSSKLPLEQSQFDTQLLLADLLDAFSRLGQIAIQLPIETEYLKKEPSQRRQYLLDYKIDFGETKHVQFSPSRSTGMDFKLCRGALKLSIRVIYNSDFFIKSNTILNPKKPQNTNDKTKKISLDTSGTRNSIDSCEKQNRSSLEGTTSPKESQGRKTSFFSMYDEENDVVLISSGSDGFLEQFKDRAQVEEHMIQEQVKVKESSSDSEYQMIMEDYDCGAKFLQDLKQCMQELL